LPSCLEHRRNTNAHLQRRNVRIQLAFRIPTNTRHSGVLPHDLRKEKLGLLAKGFNMDKRANCGTMRFG
jgi:hypothetical protein